MTRDIARAGNLFDAAALCAALARLGAPDVDRAAPVSWRDDECARFG